MPELSEVLSKEDIDKKVVSVAHRIMSDFKGRELVLIGVLKGSFVFLSDLARQLTIHVKIDFVSVSSYGNEASSSGRIQLNKEIEIDINHKHVLVVEDIIDTGLTMSYLIDYLKSFNPADIRICTMIDKQERRESEIRIDYACHTIKKGFIVGESPLTEKGFGMGMRLRDSGFSPSKEEMNSAMKALRNAGQA